jgi:hypothetical protein
LAKTGICIKKGEAIVSWIEGRQYLCKDEKVREKNVLGFQLGGPFLIYKIF